MRAHIFRCPFTVLGLLIFLLSGCGGTIPAAGLYESRQEASFLTLEVTQINGQARVRLLARQWYASCGQDTYLRLSPWLQAVPITQGTFQHQSFTGQVLAGDQIAIRAVIKNSACGIIEIKTIAVLKKPDQ